ncbi:MAG: hypothetical protein K2O00_07970 [Muribaculaceae bacterium]|nr:hypothetical protein [Muribaculaceae bacterium]
MAPTSILARTLFFDGQAHDLMLITPQGNGKFHLEPFSGETPSTIFENDMLALIPDDVQLPVGNEPDDIIRRLCEPVYRIRDNKLRLISITRRGCSDYRL